MCVRAKARDKNSIAHICATKQSGTKSLHSNIGTIPNRANNMPTNFELKRLKLPKTYNFTLNLIQWCWFMRNSKLAHILVSNVPTRMLNTVHCIGYPVCTVLVSKYNSIFSHFNFKTINHIKLKFKTLFHSSTRITNTTINIERIFKIKRQDTAKRNQS